MNLGLNLVQVPLLLRFWPQETYGLWLGVAALSTLLTSLDGGHQAYVGNLLNRNVIEGEVALRGTLAGAVRVAALTSTVQLVLAAVLCLSGWAAHWLGLARHETAEFSLAVLIYTIGSISTGSVGAILVKLFPPTGFFVRSTIWATGMRFGQFAAVVVAAWLGWGLVGTTWLYASVVLAVNIWLFLDIRRVFPELFPWWQGGTLRVGLRNFYHSSMLTGVSVLDLVSLQGVVLLVTGTLGAALVPLFTSLRTLANTAMQGTGFLLNPIQPDLVRYHVQHEGTKLEAVFGFFWLVTGVVVNGGVIAGLFVVEPFFALWTRGRLAFDRPLFAWLAAAVVVRTLAAPFQAYLTSINHLRALGATSVVRAVLTVGGALGMIPIWGLGGAGAAVFAAEIVGSLILPWRFTRRSIASLGVAPGLPGMGLAGFSTALACSAVGSFACHFALWRWVAGIALVTNVVAAAAQWRHQAPDVRQRALSLVRPAFGGLIPIR